MGIIAVATSAVAVGRLSRDGLFSGMIEAVTASGALGDGRLRSPPPSSTTEISGSSSNVTVMESKQRDAINGMYNMMKEVMAMASMGPL